MDNDLLEVDGRVDGHNDRFEGVDVRMRQLEENFAEIQITTALTDEAAARDVANLREQVDQQGYLVNGHEHRLMSSGDLAVNKISALKTKVDSSDVVAHAAIFMAVGLQEDVRKLQSANEAELKTININIVGLQKDTQSNQQQFDKIQTKIVKMDRLEKDGKMNSKLIKALQATVNAQAETITKQTETIVALQEDNKTLWSAFQYLKNKVRHIQKNINIDVNTEDGFNN